MEPKTNTCAICLTQQTTLFALSETDSTNASHCDKLKTSVPEVEWSPEEKICGGCVAQLESVCAFRKRCIYSHSLHAQFHRDDSETPPQKLQRANRTSFQCEDCDAQFKTSKKLTSHALEAHERTIAKPFRCDKCGSRFSKSSNLHQHKKYHVGSRDSVCTFCGKGFVTKSDLLIHEKKHLNKREYGCGLCPKKFNTHKDLRSHKLIVHSDPATWSYACGVCGKRFPIKSNHDQHVRRHAGEKRFACHLCEKRFMDKGVLKRHVNSHSNVRAFRCDRCGREYKEKRRLDLHLKRVHGVGEAKLPPERAKRFFCGECPKAFVARSKLEKHAASHSGEKPFACEVCTKRFVDKYYARQHLRNVHGLVADV